MDAAQIAALIGTMIGATVASLAGTWLTLVRPMSRRMAEQAQAGPPQEPPRLRSSTSRDNLRVADIANARIERLEEDLRRLEEIVRETTDAVAKRLTTEEFQAYTTFVTSALHTVTEKVGEVRGQLMKGGGR